MLNPISEVVAGIVQRSRESNAPAPDDPVIDGLRHCKVCGKPKELRLNFGDKEVVVGTICDCRKAEIEAEEKRRKHQEEMAAIARLRDASLMSAKYRQASFAAYIQRPENQRAYRIGRNYCDRFIGTPEKPGMYEMNQGLLFYGPVGSGKSYTAACIANELLDKSISVVMTSFVKILQDVQNGKIEEAEYIRIINRAKLLIIDDLGAERNTDYALEKVYNVIESRCREAKPMVLTTNLTMQEITGATDIRLKRIYDRILECCYPVQITGQSFRMMEAAQRHRDMRQLLEEQEDT